jgi:membrane protein implicated in regulation of membrane protease activity
LDEAIINGSGKLKIEDALWDVDGPDLPAGAKVKVIGVNGLRLVAEKAN